MIKSEIEFDGFIVKYSIEENNIGNNKVLYDLIVDDICIGKTSVMESLNNNFNTYKSSFRRKVIRFAEEKHPNTMHFLSIKGGLSGYFDD